MLAEDSMSEEIFVHEVSHADKCENEALFENALKTRLAGDFVFRPTSSEARKLVNDHESEKHHEEAITSAEEPAHETDDTAEDEMKRISEQVIGHARTSQRDLRFPPQSMCIPHL